MLTAVLQEVRKAKAEPGGATPGSKRDGEGAVPELQTDATPPMPMGAEPSERSYR